ncbi:oligosaccharide flippase family protein [Chryseobacterium sp. RG1]|uniref:Oligosaccharide flippase family protein n=1 Tax=Chryseobacterium tagetis TaxID=2801334 RepID=A0ABS8A741_9FLAO|nr:oligosaccharide flippase family protein [Chryseobacterium tagetis]MCA6069128.1 oligosaccharide flippase family protein [Chryseobacterium tagetis]
MNSKKKTIINVITSGGQVALVGVIYYFLYKFLLQELGVKRLGVWSVVMSASSVANLADLGIATSMVRFVALYDHQKNLKRIPHLIFTGVVLNLLIFIPVCLIIWPSAYYILGNIIEKDYIYLARQLLPFSLLCVLINSLSGVYGSLLDGFRKNYLRNFIFTFSSVVFFLLSFWSVKKYGLIGVVWSQVIQSLISLILCILISVRLFKFNPLKWRWSSYIFKEIFSYGIKFQLTSITGILNEPVTKMLLAKFGGLAFAGYYEMANKLVMQIRGVIVSANQSLIPLLVKESVESKNKNYFSVLSISFAAVFIIALISLSSINIISSFISVIWIGKEQYIFINILLFLSVCMFINLLSAPTYFSLISTSKLGPVIRSQLLMAFINIVLGFVLGYSYHGYGIVLTWMIVVIVGSVYLLNSVGFKNTFSFIQKYQTAVLSLLVINILAVVFSRLYNDLAFIIFIINLCVFIFILYINLVKKNN